mmetsp:Transcript_17096/g.38848  ORF Transcript_17096/g.38848 Transcript_17096/m.38848 type:complete len:533 (-) Transcript_17096:6-1604(-)
MGAICGMDKDSRDGLVSATDEIMVADDGCLKNHAGGPEVTLCKFGCGCSVQPGLFRGKPYSTCCRSCAISPGAGVHDASCPGRPAGFVAAFPTQPVFRPVCPKGARCRSRTPEHLLTQAHPLDKDYKESCAAAGVEPEELSLKVLFDWADSDGSGKLSRAEVQAILGIIASLSGWADSPEDYPPITDEAWKRLDEDGNGILNFHEFSSWAGPRLGLPLGLSKMIFRSATGKEKGRPCGVVNCPCEDFCGSGSVCTGCKHGESHHKSRAVADREGHHSVPLPDYWDNHTEDFNEIVDLGKAALPEFQKLVDRTYRNVWTRDRSKHNPTNTKVPTGFQVVRVQRCENRDNWQEFCAKRAMHLTEAHEAAKEGRDHIVQYKDIKTTVAWHEIGGAKADRLAHECNEWYLFHGTSPEAAKMICTTDFKVSLAGGNTGTLYGRGLYFAESITKSDEYAKPNANGVYGVLMCRILGGRVRYTDEVSPAVEDLVQSVVEGKYDSVCGDREKCRGTYREFVIFDTEDVYPEYIIEYKRKY